MNWRLVNFSSLSLVAGVLSIWSIACGTAVIPTAAPTLASNLTGTPVANPTATATPTLAPNLTGTPVANPTATAAPTLAPNLTGTPVANPTTTAAPALGPTLTVTPVPNPTATATNFNPDLVGLAVIGSSATIAVETVGVDPEAQAVQINIQHSAELQVSSPACAGIFTGGTILGPASVAGGTAIGCVFLAGQVSGPTGVTMTFELTRIGNIHADQNVTFGIVGPLATIYSDSGNTIDPGTTNQLIVSPGSR